MIAGNTALHSGNYNSYAPTLTGTGASGTWGINVTGTAASETLATVTARGASTSTAVTLSNTANHYAGHHYFDAFDAAGNHYPHYQAGSDGTGAIANIRVAQSGGTHKLFILNGKDGTISWNGNTVWHAGNDGSGSSLDADFLDGYDQATANTANTIVRRDGSGNFSAGTITAALTGAASDRKSTRLNSSHVSESRMPSSA